MKKDSSEDEYVLISALMGTVTHGSKDWLIDSGSSKHMIGFKEYFLGRSYSSSTNYGKNVLKNKLG